MSLSNYLLRATSIALFGLVAACTSVTKEERGQVAEVSPPASTVEASIAADKNAPGRVVLYREWNGEGLAFLGSGPKVQIDGREVGRCLLGDGTEITLAAGEHEIQAPHSEVSRRRFRIEADQTIYVKCKYTIGALVPNVQFEFFATRKAKK